MRSNHLLYKGIWHFNIWITVKPVYNSLGYNKFPVITKHIIFHRSHKFLKKLFGYHENSLLTNAFGRTHLFVINVFSCALKIFKNFRIFSRVFQIFELLSKIKKGHQNFLKRSLWLIFQCREHFSLKKKLLSNHRKLSSPKEDAKRTRGNAVAFFIKI
jgi:hypothetical protein